MRNFVVIFTIFINISLSASVLFKTGVNGGYTFVNSKGLNQITAGFNETYGMSFSKISLPMSINAFVELGFTNMLSATVDFWYEFKKISSSSLTYNFREDISFYNLPISLLINAKLFYSDIAKFALYASAGVGYSYTKLSLTASPMPAGSQAATMSTNAIFVPVEVKGEYWFSEQIYAFGIIGYKYSLSSTFKYKETTSTYNEGDAVTLYDGSVLKNNMTGMRFLIGIAMQFGGY